MLKIPKKKEAPEDDVLGLESTFKRYLFVESYFENKETQQDTLLYSSTLPLQYIEPEIVDTLLNSSHYLSYTMIPSQIGGAIVYRINSCPVAVIFKDSKTCIAHNSVIRNETIKSKLKNFILSHFEFIPAITCTCTIGCDPEFELVKNGTVIKPPQLDYKNNEIGLDSSGNQIELRPKPAASAKEITDRIKSIVRDFYTRHPYELALTGHTYALGFHLHAAWKAKCSFEDAGVIVKILDRFLGRFFLPSSGKARKDYKKLNSFRVNSAPYTDGRQGFEYRVLPSAVMISPIVVELVFKIFKNVTDYMLAGGAINDTPDIATKEEYLEVAKLTEAEYSNLNKYASILRELIKTGQLITLPSAEWKLKTDAIVQFSSNDTFDGDVADEIRDIIANKLGSRVNVYIFGLSESRGLCSNIKISDWEVLDKDFSVFASGTINIGLPYDFRNKPEVFLEHKGHFITAIEVLKARINTKS